MSYTGLSLHLYTTQNEINNIKNNVSTIIAWTKENKPENAKYHISVSADVCDVLENEIRVNISKIQDYFNNLGAMMGEAMGKELEKVFKQFA